MLPSIFLFSTLIFASGSRAPFRCGQEEIIKRDYGAVDMRVSCEYTDRDGLISVLEFKPGSDTLHGTTIHYDTLWRKRDSSFYINGEQNGLAIMWDTLGNIVGRENFLKGIQVGKREVYFAPGRPALIKHYNAEGDEEGPWEEWWKNGNKKAEYAAKGGRIVSGKEFYQSGKPRAFYETKYEPENKSVLRTKYIHAEAWAPNGKSTGRIVNGKGEWILFPDASGSTKPEVFRAVYRDSVMVEGKKLDSAAQAKWLRP